ncbi:biotin--[acetyl-CoA-carboxylase] ligase [Halalkalibacter hemicellulosilyticus]|uniref:Bifunctional ligase/repressor BirA n=1 Tax=Halalkalibacter hemicellulosilyticusJCM 9152 TaxID=1236971 RepID=W4QAQ2_9BACI|nr:biotin--[acetyl-CoA-carboxylase] ligase [Halalkalibacter hemicellulosilyticus]GAE29047.1 biotin-protein ligase [Halalkalibacter hemicellulosilyticusJCM 9152]
MKESLIKLLEEKQDQFVSGEHISRLLGCSRTAIWKHIDSLRKSGYEVESAPRKGYRLVQRGEQIQPHDIKLNLTTDTFAIEQTYLSTTVSTQKVAHELLQKGVKEGHLVVANEQTNGKGRMSRAWHSPAGTSVSMSLILKPNLPPQKTPQLTLLSAVAIVRAIKQLTGLSADIKWPNDVLVNGKKLVGILTEIQSDPDLVHSVVIGVGINVNQTKDELRSDLKDKTTSLFIETKKKVDRAKLIAYVLNELESLYKIYITDGFEQIKLMWETHSISIGTHLYARTPNDVIYGFAKGITSEGFLLIEDESGVTHQIYSADIEF